MAAALQADGIVTCTVANTFGGILLHSSAFANAMGVPTRSVPTAVGGSYRAATVKGAKTKLSVESTAKMNQAKAKHRDRASIELLQVELEDADREERRRNRDIASQTLIQLCNHLKPRLARGRRRSTSPCGADISANAVVAFISACCEFDESPSIPCWKFCVHLQDFLSWAKQHKLQGIHTGSPSWTRGSFVKPATFGTFGPAVDKLLLAGGIESKPVAEQCIAGVKRTETLTGSVLAATGNLLDGAATAILIQLFMSLPLAVALNSQLVFATSLRIARASGTGLTPSREIRDATSPFSELYIAEMDQYFTPAYVLVVTSIVAAVSMASMIMLQMIRPAHIRHRVLVWAELVVRKSAALYASIFLIGWWFLIFSALIYLLVAVIVRPVENMVLGFAVLFAAGSICKTSSRVMHLKGMVLD